MVDLGEEEIRKFEASPWALTAIEKVAGTVETGTDKLSLANPVVAFQWILVGFSLLSAG
jgi:hypothetical protein